MKKEKRNFSADIYLGLQKNEHASTSIWFACEFGAPGFISTYKYNIIKFVFFFKFFITSSIETVWALHWWPFVYLFGLISFFLLISYYSYLAIVGTDVRIYIPLRWMHWDHSRRSTCNYFCVVLLFFAGAVVALILLLLFKLSYHSQVLLLMVLFSLLLILLLSPKIIHWCYFMFSHVNISIDMHLLQWNGMEFHSKRKRRRKKRQNTCVCAKNILCGSM